MVSKTVLKVIGVVSILLMVLNLVLFILGKINGLVFWGVIVFGAVFAFIALPKMKK